MRVLDITAAEYHDDQVADQPALSASIANILLARSPLHAWAAHPKLNPAYQRKTDDKFDLGTAVHSFLLDTDPAVQVIEAENYRTNAAKDARDVARDAGLTPVLAGQWARIRPMLGAIRAQLEEHEADPTPYTDGRSEQTLLWEEDGVTLKARIDWLHDTTLVVDDFKTTAASASPDSWGKTMFGFAGDVQAAFYLRGIREVFGVDAVFRWVVVELEPPYALSVLSPDATTLDIANDKVETAIRKWRECLAGNVWPGYSRSVRMVTPPPWAETQWLERRDA